MNQPGQSDQHPSSDPTPNVGVAARAHTDAGTERSPDVNGDMPFERVVSKHDSVLLVDEILPPGTLIESASVDVLNGYINYVEPKVIITERDPEEDERYISISNQFYTHFHEFGTVIHVIAASTHHYWYFCYDIDASDCTIGRVRREDVSVGRLIAWVYHERVTRRYPILEIDPSNLHGFRSFQ